MQSYSHLSDDERDQIGILRASGRSIAAIARALGRAKTTISRELQRNALPSGGYSPLHAAGDRPAWIWPGITTPSGYPKAWGRFFFCPYPPGLRADGAGAHGPKLPFE
jgi:hypothetical protein